MVQQRIDAVRLRFFGVDEMRERLLWVASLPLQLAQGDMGFRVIRVRGQDFTDQFLSAIALATFFGDAGQSEFCLRRQSFHRKLELRGGACQVTLAKIGARAQQCPDRLPQIHRLTMP